jgi:hypothetical protein
MLMTVNMPTAIGAAGTTAFGAQSLVPLIDWLALHYDVRPVPTPEVEYSLALIVIGVGGAVIGSTVWLLRLLAHRVLRKYDLETSELEKADA